jgi:hypothetical protein
MMKRIKTIAIVSVVLAGAVFSAGCGPNKAILNSNAAEPASAVSTASPEPTPNTFDRDLEAMKTADFNFIYVFRRKDGGVMTADDRTFIKENTVDSNRRKQSDEDKAIIVGSNYRFPADKLKALTDRFAAENHSKPESELPKEIQNANMNANGQVKK